ncbi:MAG TPA: hypothetical protein P5150_08755, partial [Candidatus Ratteibacteria bacterium]|nr:hypothetical protein [Candidatus Ratteibacteria bacterium]
GGCFIATAAFGSPLASQVYILRAFRDRFLLTNTPGRNFVKWYYKNGPIAANFITRHPATKIVVRMSLYPLVFISYLLVSGMFWYFVLFVCSSLLLFIMLKKERKNLCV